MSGPQPQDHDTRLALAQKIAARARQIYGDQLLAIGLYGSLARGADGPFSDIEMMCILSTSGEDYTHEWAYDGWKAEVNFLSQDVALHSAAEVDFDWPRTHGSYTRTLALYDPAGFLSRLQEAALNHPRSDFRDAIHDLIVGEIYELVGKLRNARHDCYDNGLPALALSLAERGAYLAGLANSHLYTSGTRLLEESLELPDLPDGYEDLCRLALTGELNDPQRLLGVCETFWTGIETWAARNGIVIETAQEIPF